MSTYRFVPLLGFSLVQLALAETSSTKAPDGWFQENSKAAAYEVGTDKTFRFGWASAYIRSLSEEPAGHGTLVQRIRADLYRGQTVKLISFFRKAEPATAGWLYLRIDDRESVRVVKMSQKLGPDERGEWFRHELVVAVPVTAVGITLGAGLSGSGQLWVEDVVLEVVSPAYRQRGEISDLRIEASEIEDHKARLKSYSDAPLTLQNGDFEGLSAK